jgi:ankyrin repeat protein
MLACHVDADLIDSEGYTALMYACAFGKLEAAMLLMEAGTSPLVADMDDQTALMLATYHEHADVVMFLLTCGVDVGLDYCDYRGKTAWAKACAKARSPEMLKVTSALLRHGASPSVADFEFAHLDILGQKQVPKSLISLPHDLSTCTRILCIP